MKHIEQQLSLDMVEISHNVVNARENDKLIRDLDITLTEKGYSYPIQLGAYVYIRGKRADGKSVFYSADIVDQELGKIHVNIHDYLLSVSGRCTLDIGIYNRIQTNPGNVADEIVSTEPFILYVPNGVFDENDVVNSDEGSALAKLINSARDEIAEMNALETDVANNENIRQYSETERQKNESTRKNNESDRNNAENERKNNEIERNNAENVRKENEARRQSDTSSAIERANDAADKAEQKANDLQNKIDNHEIVFADDLQSHNTSVTAHDDVRNLISILSTRLNSLADSDDTTLDQLSEIVAYIKNNKSLIDGVTTSKVSKSGDTMTGKLNAYGGISLNGSTTSSVLQYILGCDAFAQGGAIHYQNVTDVSVGRLGGLSSNLYFCARTTGGNFVGNIDTQYNNGAYWCQNAANKPTTDPYGLMIVHAAGTSDVIKQTYIPHIGNGLMGAVHERIRINNVWSPWRIVETEGSNLVCGNYFYMIDNGGRKRMVLQAIEDGSGANNYGMQLVIGAGGNTFIGAGESASTLYTALQTDSNKKKNEEYTKGGENAFISADGHLYLYSNVNQVSKRKGICFSNAGNLIPVGTDSINLGLSTSPFNLVGTKCVYIADNSANGIMFGDESVMIHENANRLYLNASKGVELNHGSGDAKNSLSKGNKFLINKNFTGYDSGPHLQLTNGSYPNAKIEMKIDIEGSNITLFTNTANKLFEIDTWADNFRIYRSKNNAIATLFEWNDTDVLLGTRMKPRSNGGCALGDSSTRFSQIWCSTSLNTSSDQNLKKNIQDLSSDDRYIRFFMMLQPKSYLFKDGTSGRTHVGFISQDVEEAMTECGLTSLEFAGFCKDQKVEVITENDGTIREELVIDSEGNPVYVYSLRYEEFIALNTMMIHKLYKTNETLEDRISILEENLLGVEKIFKRLSH